MFEGIDLRLLNILLLISLSFSIVYVVINIVCDLFNSKALLTINVVLPEPAADIISVLLFIAPGDYIVYVLRVDYIAIRFKNPQS